MEEKLIKCPIWRSKSAFQPISRGKSKPLSRNIAESEASEFEPVRTRLKKFERALKACKMRSSIAKNNLEIDMGKDEGRLKHSWRNSLIDLS
jgi:hypothetical protein